MMCEHNEAHKGQLNFLVDTSTALIRATTRSDVNQSNKAKLTDEDVRNQPIEISLKMIQLK